MAALMVAPMAVHIAVLTDALVVAEITGPTASVPVLLEAPMAAPMDMSLVSKTLASLSVLVVVYLAARAAVPMARRCCATAKF